MSWESNYDRDNEQLSYDVIKNGDIENPIFSTTSRSAWWQRPYLGYLDQNVTAGQSYSYQIRATDPKGNSAYGNPISITATRSGTSLSVYDQVALGDGPQSYWAFNEGTTGSTAADLNGVDPGTRSAGVIGGVPGAIPSHPGTAYRFIRELDQLRVHDGDRQEGPAGLQHGGLVQDHHHCGRQDHRLREPVHRELHVLRPAPVHEQQRPALPRRQPRRADDQHHDLLQRRPVAPRGGDA